MRCTWFPRGSLECNQRSDSTPTVPWGKSRSEKHPQGTSRHLLQCLPSAVARAGRSEERRRRARKEASSEAPTPPEPLLCCGWAGGKEA
ncbi:hypothetical protein NDU88_001406 [Pleurodeles waltl]|uniref:Uncharacterized protein n=1 Tax=Pleurodeles waltl TaxID=8319 RepID=A0AAV7USQ2_PLEWA|nr:hypothetical protein NDU88_001406 [Pleurodeles waltl]